MNEPNPVQPKVAAAGVAGAASVVFVWIVGLFGADVPPEVASAFTTVITFGAGYLR